MKLRLIDFFDSAAPDADIEVNQNIFDLEVRKDLISRLVNWQLAKRREGNHKVKTRSEVHHTTKKPFKQKGTGRARQGMKSAPHMRGGGTAMGPCVRSHDFKLNKKVRALALRHALSARAKNQEIIVVPHLNCDKINTSKLINNLKARSLRSVLFVDSNKVDSTNFKLSVRNLHQVDYLPVVGLNVLDILKHKTIVLTTDSLTDLAERLHA